MRRNRGRSQAVHGESRVTKRTWTATLGRPARREIRIRNQINNDSRILVAAEIREMANEKERRVEKRVKVLREIGTRRETKRGEMKRSIVEWMDAHTVG